MIALLGPSQSPQIKIVAEGCDPCVNVKRCVSKVVVPKDETILQVVLNINGQSHVIQIPDGGDPIATITAYLTPFALFAQGDFTYVLDQNTGETILTLMGQVYLVAVFSESGEVAATLMCDIVTECTYKQYVPGGPGQILNVDSNTYNIPDFTIGITPIGDVLAFYQSVFIAGVVVTVTENTVIGKYEVSLTYAGNHQISVTSGSSTTNQMQCGCNSLYVDLNKYNVFTI